VVSYAPLKLVTPWQGFYFGHAFSKTCQYACNDATICFAFYEVNNQPCKKQLRGLISPAKVAMNGRGHALMHASAIKK
jgi:hypothetical protein